jgi:hypothetical protein
LRVGKCRAGIQGIRSGRRRRGIACSFRDDRNQRMRKSCNASGGTACPSCRWRGRQHHHGRGYASFRLASDGRHTLRNGRRKESDHGTRRRCMHCHRRSCRHDLGSLSCVVASSATAAARGLRRLVRWIAPEPARRTAKFAYLALGLRGSA